MLKILFEQNTIKPIYLSGNLSSFFKYLELEKRYSKHTILAYKNDLDQYCLYIRTTYMLKQLEHAQHTHIRSWMVQLMEAGIKPVSINRKLSSLKTYYKFALKKGWILVNPMNKVISPKTSKRLPTFLSGKSMALLFQNVNFPNDYNGCRDKMMLELLYQTGVRRAELIGLSIDDVDLINNKIRVLGKGRKERIIPFSTDLKEKLKDYIDCRQQSFPNAVTGSLFLTEKGKSLYPKLVYNVVKRYLSQVTTQDKRSPHILRHTFATHLTDEGADLNAVKELLGHSSLASTQVYTHNSIEKLKRVYKQAHPKA